jgi:DNA-binding transcriptional regulator YdaS (Cro superfamily)
MRPIRPITDCQRDLAKAAWQEAKEKVRPQRLIYDALGVTRSAIAQWDIVPVDKAIAIEQITGVTRDRLRPDIYGFPSDHTASNIGPRQDNTSRHAELLDEIETAFDMLTVLDKAGDGIRGDVGHGISAVALAARSALDNARSMVRAMGAK